MHEQTEVCEKKYKYKLIQIEFLQIKRKKEISDRLTKHTQSKERYGRRRDERDGKEREEIKNRRGLKIGLTE